VIRQLGRGFGYLDSHLKYGLVDGAAHGQMMTTAPGR